ncbi:hypothetical protein KEM52_005733 [Ascosphaera acerosa]|nr:hypothetical protein KEM52_005733 [Ascosphaera acerosa]
MASSIRSPGVTTSVMDDQMSLLRRDSQRGPPLRILSLDGGGVRGFSMFILLQELMYRTYVEINGEAPTREQIPKPCDMFDLIVGTGTGGLIAIMLGRLRMDLETCKEVYVRMTRRVFETDKTLGGIPIHSTMFKASKLEEAICDCVGEHTRSMSEGNDGSASPDLSSPTRPPPSRSGHGLGRRLSRVSSGSFGRGGSKGMVAQESGNPYAALYDNRPFRCKTAVTAVYKNTPPTGKPILLRSYDSRREPPPDFNCTIWQAGRATCASALAFKPVKIGQYELLDEGAMNYNPAPQALDEAVLNEWPGREVGVFVSIGTGKRSPTSAKANQQEWWEGIVGNGISQFAEARRRLITKIDGCEKTHEYMLREHLQRRGVPLERYMRLNVNVGVGGFKMNEWQRLGEISTSTRMYLGKEQIQQATLRAAQELARLWYIHQQTPMRRNGSVSGSVAAPSFISYRPYDEDGYFSDSYVMNRLPCCPEDQEVGHSRSDSTGSSTTSQPLPLAHNQLRSPHQSLRRRNRYSMSLRLSTPVTDGPALDLEFGTRDAVLQQQTPLSPSRHQNGTATAVPWTASDVPQPLNVDRKNSEGTISNRSPTSLGPKRRSRIVEADPVQTEEHVHVVASPHSQHAAFTDRPFAMPMPMPMPMQRKDNQCRDGVLASNQPLSQSHPPAHYHQRSPAIGHDATPHVTPQSRVSNAVLLADGYSSIIPPYPDDEDDSIVRLPDEHSFKGSRPSTGRPAADPDTRSSAAEPSAARSSRPLEASEDGVTPAAAPVPPPRAPSRLWSTAAPGTRLSMLAEGGVEATYRHRRQASSNVSNAATVFSEGNAGGSHASVGTTITTPSSPSAVRSWSASNDGGEACIDISSTVAVVDGDMQEPGTRTSGGRSPTLTGPQDHDRVHNQPETPVSPHFMPEGPPAVNRETKPVLNPAGDSAHGPAPPHLPPIATIPTLASGVSYSFF